MQDNYAYLYDIRRNENGPMVNSNSSADVISQWTYTYIFQFCEVY